MAELYKWMHTCECGYSLLSAYGFLGGQKEVTRMLNHHKKTIHGQD